MNYSKSVFVVVVLWTEWGEKTVWRWNYPFVFYWEKIMTWEWENIDCSFKCCCSSHVQWWCILKKKKSRLQFMILFLFFVLLLSLDLQIYLYCIFMLVHFNSIYCIQQKWATMTPAPFSPCLVPKLAFLPSVFPSDTLSDILSEHLRPWYIILSQKSLLLFQNKIKNNTFFVLMPLSDRVFCCPQHICDPGPFLCHHKCAVTLVYVLLCIMQRTNRGELLRR